MNHLDLNAMGVREMSEVEMKTVEGKYWYPTGIVNTGFYVFDTWIEDGQRYGGVMYCIA